MIQRYSDKKVIKINMRYIYVLVMLPVSILAMEQDAPQASISFMKNNTNYEIELHMNDQIIATITPKGRYKDSPIELPLSLETSPENAHWTIGYYHSPDINIVNKDTDEIPATWRFSRNIANGVMESHVLHTAIFANNILKAGISEENFVDDTDKYRIEIFFQGKYLEKTLFKLVSY